MAALLPGSINAAEVNRPTQPRLDSTRRQEAEHVFLLKARRLTRPVLWLGALRLRLIPSCFQLIPAKPLCLSRRSICICLDTCTRTHTDTHTHKRLSQIYIPHLLDMTRAVAALPASGRLRKHAGSANGRLCLSITCMFGFWLRFL